MKPKALPPLLTIAQALELVRAEGLELTAGQLKRLLVSASTSRKGKPSKWPELIVYAGRKWLIRKIDLRDYLGLEDDPGVGARVYDLEMKLERIERSARR